MLINGIILFFLVFAQDFGVRQDFGRRERWSLVVVEICDFGVRVATTAASLNSAPLSVAEWSVSGGTEVVVQFSASVVSSPGYKAVKKSEFWVRRSY